MPKRNETKFVSRVSFDSVGAEKIFVQRMTTVRANSARLVLFDNQIVTMFHQREILFFQIDVTIQRKQTEILGHVFDVQIKIFVFDHRINEVLNLNESSGLVADRTFQLKTRKTVEVDRNETRSVIYSLLEERTSFADRRIVSAHEIRLSMLFQSFDDRFFFENPFETRSLPNFA